MTRRIVHYTDDARSPVNGTEGISDVWQGFRYDFAVLLSEIEKTELSRGAKKALCEDLADLLDGMKEGVNRLYWYTDFMAGWKEGFAEIPVKETPAKKKRGRAEPCVGGTAEGLFPDAEGCSDAEPGEDANKGTPACGDSPDGGASDETAFSVDSAEDIGTYDGPDSEGGADLSEGAKEEDSCGKDAVTEEYVADETNPGEDALKGDASDAEENAVTEMSAGVDVIIGDIPYSSKEELAAARFMAEHGSGDDEDGTPSPANVTNDVYGGDEKDGGAEDDDRVPEKSED